FVDDCNHDVDGLFAKSFERQMADIFGGDALRKLPDSHPLYSSFFRFPDGPPATSYELNGWGDDLVHDYLKGIEVDGRLGVLYSNKDYGCEWDYDWRNKRFLAEDNTKFAGNIVVYALSACRPPRLPTAGAATAASRSARSCFPHVIAVAARPPLSLLPQSRRRTGSDFANEPHARRIRDPRTAGPPRRPARRHRPGRGRPGRSGRADAGRPARRRPLPA